MGEKEDKLLRQFQEDARVHVYDKERHAWVVTTWLTTLDKMVASMAEKFGWDAVNEQLKVFWTRRAQERLPHGVARATAHGEPRDCVTLGKMITGGRIGYADYEILEITPKRLHLLKKGCDEAIVLKETGLMGKMYWPCTTLWAKTAAEMLNPKIKQTFVKAECEGDDVCEMLCTLEE